MACSTRKPEMSLRHLLLAMSLFAGGAWAVSAASISLSISNGPRVTLGQPLAAEEFLGPYASWLDAKRDFGAVGDGMTDDTDALQAALDTIRWPTNAPVLFLPRGTYRISRCLDLGRTGHEDSKDVTIVGENPTNTMIRWEGPPGGTMLKFGAWWSRVSRLTFDGRAQAGTAIAHGDLYSAINELSDLVIQDVNIGIEAGNMSGTAVSETAVLRCRFLRCATAGLSLQNWNSLDWFLWDCQFEDCRYGVANIYGAGNFHVYRSQFRRSTEADIAIGNTSYFSIRDCNSWGSRRFFHAGGTGAPALLTLQGNTVLAPQEVPIVIGNLGPLLLIDNIIHTPTNQALTFEQPAAGLVAVGNLCSTTNLYAGTTNVLAFDNRSRPANKMIARLSSWAAVPAACTGAVIEVPPGATRSNLQQAIDLAAARSAERPTIHLPAGVYSIDQTLQIPAHADIRIAGDGGKTHVKWINPSPGIVFQVQGPTRLTMRDLHIHGSSLATGIQINGCDQSRASIWMDQVDVRYQAEAGFKMSELSRARIHLGSCYHSLSRIGVQVVGRHGAAGGSLVALFGGASSDNEISYDISDGGRLLVQDTWYETRMPDRPRFMSCTNAGSFTLHGGNIAPLYSELEPPPLLIEGFQGQLSFLNTILTFPNTRVVTRGDGKKTKLLLLGVLSESPADLEATNTAVANLKALQSTVGGGCQPLPDEGTSDPRFLRQMLGLTRQEKPPLVPLSKRPATEILLHRVFVEAGTVGVSLTR